MNWKKKFNKVIKELNIYIEWRCGVVYDIYEPLIWDIYYEKYRYNVKLSDVFSRKSSSIIKIDFQEIYKIYLNEDVYKNIIEPYLNPIELSNDVILNIKYELVLKIDILKPIQIYILNYLIC